MRTIAVALVGLARRHTLGAFRQALTLASWAFVYVTLLLAAMAGLIIATTGWQPVVITSSSMSPALRPGDVVFIGDHPDELLGQRSIVTFERNGEYVSHRVIETRLDSAEYVTKGDANPTADTDLIGRDDVVGVGRFVVPFLGLPIVWANEQNVGPLIGLSVVALGALLTGLSAIGRRPRHGHDRSARFSGAAQRGIGSVRLVVGLMIGAQFVVDSRQFDPVLFGLSRTQTLLTALVALASISVIAAARSRLGSDERARRLAAAELIGDTLVVVFLVAASGSSGVAWVLMALPIIEAAIHFRLTGAFVHWTLMSALSVAALFMTSSATDRNSSVVIEELEHLVDRLGVLLLVVIPGSYLAEQLLGEVFNQRAETTRARHRSRILEQVTEAGHNVTRLGNQLFDELIRSARALGFDTAEAWVGAPSGHWQRISDSSDLALPVPGAPGSGLRTEDLSTDEIVIDASDPEVDEFDALAVSGASVLIRLTLALRDDIYVVLRVGARRLDDDPTSQVMGLRLLSAQAEVALQNEQLLTELQRTHDELEHQARYDSLTGLANRSQFVDTLEAALRSDAPTTLMFLDLDGFKAINDRLGHSAGDGLLRAVAARVVTAVGDAGDVARLGGDEFTVLIRGVDRTTAESTADSIHLALGQPFDLGDDFARIGVSIGVAHSEPGIIVSELLRRADVAMYAAKTSDAAWRTVCYERALDETQRRTERLASAFRSSLENNELRLAYQPVVDALSGRIVGLEALLRWRHREVGPIPAPTIVEIAELTGSVDELNSWVFRTALTEAAAATRALREDDDEFFVAVNVSPRELELDSLVANVQAALHQSGLEPSRVVVELSERIVADAHSSVGNVRRLTDLGLGLALDDFGEGQTSLAHLRGLPIRFLKLDRAFVQHADESEEDRKILRSVVGLAHDLGFLVIAEGIETDQQRAVVAVAGADLLQGFGLHRPEPIDEIRRVLRYRVTNAALPPAHLVPGRPARPLAPLPTTGNPG